MIAEKESFVFKIQLIGTSNNTAEFKTQPPKNLSFFSTDDQETLLSFIISQFESMPVMASNEETTPIPSGLIGEEVELTLKQGGKGFEVGIVGPESILMSEHSGNFARAIHKELLTLEAECL